MLQEVGKVLSAIAAVVVTVTVRVWRGMQWLVRRARATRTATGQGTPRLARLLDVAALSVTADVLVVAELWRRGGPPGLAWAAVVGLLAAVVLAVGVLAMPRDLARYAWAGLTVVRIASLAGFALVPPAVTTGVGSPFFLSTLSMSTLIAMLLVDRHVWTVVARGLVAPTLRGRFVGGTLRYVAFVLPFAVLAGFIGLVVGGLFTLVLAEAALLAVAVVVLTLPAPSVVVAPLSLSGKRPALPSPPQPITPTEILPPASANPASAEPEGFTVYRPSSLD